MGTAKLYSVHRDTGSGRARRELSGRKVYVFVVASSFLCQSELHLELGAAGHDEGEITLTENPKGGLVSQELIYTFKNN